MIELKNVSFAYQGREKEALCNINLKIADGECVLLCGRSGCGKTTVTRLINGLVPAFYSGVLTGRVLIDGTSVSDLPMYRTAGKVGSVFQNPRTQFFNVDTDSEIAFGIENQGFPPEALAVRVERTATDLRIGELRGRNLYELSGGEKQKIAFASVYAMNPDIYLLDEPSSNLDAASVHELKERLALIKRQKKTILIAEHRLYYLMDIVDKVIYMDQGRIAGMYTPEELRQMPDEKRRGLGLRSVDLKKEPPAGNAPEHAEPLLELRGVSLFHKKRTIAEQIYLSAGRGDIIAVAGRNGAGKTTFSRALCGLHRECAGVFAWGGGKPGPKERLRLSYLVMQDVNYELFAESVEAECSFGIKHPDRDLVKKTMEALGLTPFRDLHPSTLSGGQKQRVAVAVSMICKKDLLIFDEPTSGLDYDSMTQVANLLLALSAAGKVIFVATHDYEFVCRTCSRVFHMGRGGQYDDLSVSPENGEKLRKIFSA